MPETTAAPSLALGRNFSLAKCPPLMHMTEERVNPSDSTIPKDRRSIGGRSLTGQPVRLNHPERPPLDWGPEQTIVVHVSDYMPELEALLANFLPGSAATKVNVYLSAFYFADGMEWGLGRYSVPDPDHPGKFKPLPANYFPGKRGRNWPPGYNQ